MSGTCSTSSNDGTSSITTFLFSHCQNYGDFTRCVRSGAANLGGKLQNDTNGATDNQNDCAPKLWLMVVFQKGWRIWCMSAWPMMSTRESMRKSSYRNWNLWWMVKRPPKYHFGRKHQPTTSNVFVPPGNSWILLHNLGRYINTHMNPVPDDVCSRGCLFRVCDCWRSEWKYFSLPFVVAEFTVARIHSHSLGFTWRLVSMHSAIIEFEEFWINDGYDLDEHRRLATTGW